jgi:hypothetical protein
VSIIDCYYVILGFILPVLRQSSSGAFPCQFNEVTFAAGAEEEIFIASSMSALLQLGQGQKKKFSLPVQ